MRRAWPATCRPRRTWASIAGTITASACRGRTSRERFGTPNACTACHANRSAAWASAALDRWRTPTWRQRPHFAETFAKARQGRADAVGGLTAIASDARQPGMVRASALELLQDTGPAQLESSLDALAGDPDPLVRLAVAQGLATARTSSARPHRRPSPRGSAPVHSRRCGVGPGWRARRVAARGTARGARAQPRGPSRIGGVQRRSAGVLRQPGLARGTSWQCRRSHRRVRSRHEVRAMVPAGLRQPRGTPAAGGQRGCRRADVAPCAGGGRPEMPACSTPWGCRSIASSDPRRP